MSLLLNFLNTTYTYFSPPPASPQSLPPISRQPSSSSSPSPLTSPLKERLDAACLSPTSTLAHLSLSHMRRELDVTKHDLARAHVDTTRLEERCKMLEKTLKETRELLRSREAELEKVRRERDRERAMAERRRSDGVQYAHHAQGSSSGNSSRSLDTRMSSSDLARHRMHLHEQDASRTPSPSQILLSANTTSNGHSTTSNGHNNATTTPATDEDRARLRSAETYMTRTDSWSGAQVLQAVHDINSEILQFAASATEMCNFLHAPALSSNPKLAQTIQDTTARIGPSITRILANREHSQDPLLVQLALQGCVSLCIARALNAFCIGFPSKSDAVLAQIHGHMQLTEPQPTAAKWRALTHSHIHAIYPTLAEYSVNELSDTILRWCADIFTIANGHSFSPSSPVQSPSSSPPISFSPPPGSAMPQTPAAQLRVLYLDQIKRISRAVMRLASVTREDIMSTAFEVTIADPSGSFEENEMVDAFGSYAESHGQVLVTMELGLRCVTRTATNEVSERRDHGSGGSGTEGVLESRLLLPPKVVLESVLEVLDR